MRAGMYPVIPGWSEGPDLRCAIAHRGISRFRVQRFALPRNEWCLLRERTRWLQVQRVGVDLVAGARIDLGHDRIVAGDDAVGVAGEALNGIPALEHVAEIIEDRKRAAAMHVGVVMRRVG